ncbi:MAG TPA: ATP-binding protein [Herbaspirillum sp.]|jgi:magnesium chelatase subunit D
MIVYPTYYPFSAIVGQTSMKTALLLCGVDPTLGGVLVVGDKGSAKSTAARALTAVLPHITHRDGCQYRCDPDAPCAICPVCNVEHPEDPLASSVRFVTLPLGASEERLTGSLDMERVARGGPPEHSFRPGVLAEAHRGVLYIDEVNLLPARIVDILLDVAAMGVNNVQRDGIGLNHPSRFTLIGTMNPEEGNLRPQLLDRFALMVDVRAPRDKEQRAEVIRRRFAYDADPDGFIKSWNKEQVEMRRRLYEAQCLLPQVEADDATLLLISHLCCAFDVASLRADIVMHKASRALAALDGRLAVIPDDVRTAAELVLPHRRERKPHEQIGLDPAKLDELMH